MKQRAALHGLAAGEQGGRAQPGQHPARGRPNYSRRLQRSPRSPSHRNAAVLTRETRQLERDAIDGVRVDAVDARYHQRNGGWSSSASEMTRPRP